MCMVAEQTLLQLGATTHRLLKLFVMETKLICLMCNAVTSQTCKITEGHQHKLLFIVVVREAVLWARLTQPFRTKTTNRCEAEVRIVGKYVGPGHLLCLTSALFFPATAVSSSSLLLFLRFLLCLCLELQSTSKMIVCVHWNVPNQLTVYPFSLTCTVTPYCKTPEYFSFLLFLCHCSDPWVPQRLFHQPGAHRGSRGPPCSVCKCHLQHSALAPSAFPLLQSWHFQRSSRIQMNNTVKRRKYQTDSVLHDMLNGSRMETRC